MGNKPHRNALRCQLFIVLQQFGLDFADLPSFIMEANMIKVVYLGINVSDCQLAERLWANANSKWLLVMCEVAYWYNNSLPSLQLPLPPFHLLPVWVRKIPGWLLRGPLCSWTKGLLSLRVAECLVSGMRSFCWRRERGRDVIQNLNRRLCWLLGIEAGWVRLEGVCTCINVSAWPG